MALAIATNNAALRAAASASSVNRDMETSMARLSTGKRINSASDDAAGVAISSRLSAEIRGANQAILQLVAAAKLFDNLAFWDLGGLLLGNRLMQIGIERLANRVYLLQTAVGQQVLQLAGDHIHAHLHRVE